MEQSASHDLEGAIEALLFVTDEPVSVINLAAVLEVGADQAQEALSSIRDRLEAQDSGIQLREVAGGWRLFTHPRYHSLIEKYVLSWDTRKLSAAALETLSIIAYMQPVTRAQVSSVRGVTSDSSISSLVEKGLVREVGVADSPGNPSLYGTTKAFLERFGLNSVKDLTDISEFAPDEETRRLIAERLGATNMVQVLADTALSNADTEEAQGMSEVQSEIFGVVDKINFDELEFDFSDE